MNKKELRELFLDFNIEIDEWGKHPDAPARPVWCVLEAHKYRPLVEPDGIVSYGIYNRQDLFNPPAV